MKVKKLESCWVIRLQKGEEIIATLTEFTQQKKIKGAFFFGLGVAHDVTLGYFDAHKKSYIKKRFAGEHEFTSLSGNISHFGKQVIVHAHATITDRRFRAFGGHVFEAYIPATCEIIVLPLSKKLKRKKNSATGLNLLDLA